MSDVQWVTQWIKARSTKANKRFQKEIESGSLALPGLLAIEAETIQRMDRQINRSSIALFLLMVSGSWMGLTLNIQWDLRTVLMEYGELPDRVSQLNWEMGTLAVALALSTLVLGREVVEMIRLIRKHKEWFKWATKYGFGASKVVAQVQDNFKPMSEVVMKKYESLWFEEMDTSEGRRWQEFQGHYGHYPAVMEVWLEKQLENRVLNVDFSILANGLTSEKVEPIKWMNGVESKMLAKP